MTYSDDFDHDSDQQSAWSEAEKQEILRRARETVAHLDDQEILRPSDDTEPRTFSDDERREILRTARANIASYEKPEIVGDDGDCLQRGWTEHEKTEILNQARANIRRDASSGLITKVKMQDAFEAKAPEARQPRQRYQRRRSETSADDRAHRAYRDPIETTGWPEPPRESKLDACLEDLVADHVNTAFAGQHDYILDVMAQALADSVERDGVVTQAIERVRRQNRRDVRKLQAQINRLESALGELRDAVAIERTRTISLPPLPARRDFN